MLILEYENISRSFFGVPVLRDVSFTLEEGRVLGLVGENGAGKSTLVNILGGVIPPDSGKIRFRGREYSARRPADAFRQGIGFIHQELNLFTNLDIAENIFISRFPRRRIAGIPWIDARAIRSRAGDLLESVGLRLPPGTIVERLSLGERQLVEIAKALSLDARLIIFDEPTTSLTAPEAERLFELIGRLRARGISMIYISHSLGDVFRLSDDVVVLRDGRIVASGAAHEFTIDEVVTHMVGRNISQYYPSPSRKPGGPIAMQVRGLSDPGIVENINLDLHHGEIVGLAGLMGAGRSELARILFGLDRRERGEILVDGALLQPGSPRAAIRAGIAFLTENRREEGLLMEASISENIALVSLPAFVRRSSRLLDSQRLSREVSRIADVTGIKCADVDRQKVKTLSGGNQQKAVLAKWLLRRPSICILDEPTRGIDVGARHEVYRTIRELADRGTGVLFISSEIEELMGMCDRMLVMSAGEITDSLDRSSFDRERILRSALRRTSA